MIDGAAGRALDAYLLQQEAAGFSGALVAAREGRIVLLKGYGFAERAAKQPFTPATVTTMGSITKMFTAAAVLKLQMQGRLSVNDPIGRHLPNVPAEKARITIHELLTHTSGYGLGLGSDEARIGRDEFVRLALAAPLEHPPGTTPHYSNVAFGLAAAIIESASKQPYERFLHDQLFAAAGMDQTGYALPGWPLELLAHGYRGDTDAGTLVGRLWGPEGPGWNLFGNGGIHTTPGDMFRWAQALSGSTILSTDAMRLFFTPYVREDPESDLSFAYGCGIMQDRRGKPFVFKNGGDGVFYAELRLYRDEHAMFYVVSTNAQHPAHRLVGDIDRLLFQ